MEISPHSQLKWAEPATVATSRERPKRNYTTKADWDCHKERIRELRRNDVRLADIKRIMEEDIGFSATEAQYKRRFEVWGDKRKLSKSQRRYMIQQMMEKGKTLVFKRPGGEVVDGPRVQRIWDKRDRDGDIRMDIALSPDGMVTITPPVGEETRTPKRFCTGRTGAESVEDQLREFGKWLLNFLGLSEDYQYEDADGGHSVTLTNFEDVEFSISSLKRTYKELMDEAATAFANRYISIHLKPPRLSTSRLSSNPLNPDSDIHDPGDGCTSDRDFRSERPIRLRGFGNRSSSPGSWPYRRRREAMSPTEHVSSEFEPPIPQIHSKEGSLLWGVSSPLSNTVCSTQTRRANSKERTSGSESRDKILSFSTRSVGDSSSTQNGREVEEHRRNQIDEECLETAEEHLAISSLQRARELELSYNFKEAEFEYSSVCHRLLLRFGLDHKASRIAMLAFGRFYRKQFQFEKAWKPLWRAVTGQGCFKASCKTCGCLLCGDRPDKISIAAFGIVAEIYTLTGRHSLAVKLSGGLLRLQAWASRDHMESNEELRSLERYAWILINSGAYQAAMANLRVAEEIMRRRPRSSICVRLDLKIHMNYIETMACRPYNYLERELLEDLSVRETKFPNMIRNLCDTVLRLADLNAVRNDYSKAIGYYERALLTLKRTFGPEHPQTVRVVDYLVPVLSERGLVIYARPVAHYVLKVMEKQYGPFDPEVLAAILQASQLSLQVGLLTVT